jgi:hypothetical protein
MVDPAGPLRTQPRKTASSTSKVVLLLTDVDAKPLASTTVLGTKGSSAAARSEARLRTPLPAKSPVHLVIAVSVRLAPTLGVRIFSRGLALALHALAQSLLAGLKQANEFNSFFNAIKVLYIDVLEVLHGYRAGANLSGDR